MDEINNLIEQNKAKQQLAETIHKITDDIALESDPQKLDDLTNLFKANQKKREYCRIARLNDLQDLIDAELLTRVGTYADAIDNKELVSMMNATQNSLTSINQSIDQVPQIQITNNEVHINEKPPLDHDSRQRVLDAVNDILGSLHKEDSNNIIDINPEEGDD